MDTQTNAGSFNPQQKMMAFAFLADITSGMIYSTAPNAATTDKTLQAKVETSTYEQLKSVISAKVAGDTNTVDITDYIGKGWTCHKNPWVKIETNNVDATLARNTTAIFVNGDNVVVGVAGTNFIDNYDWFTEDLDVEDTIDWSQVIKELSGTLGTANSGFIAKGTFTSLQNTWLQAGAVSGKTLPETLKDVVAGKDKINLTVTGHSLGGAICPVVALALSELRSEWCPAGATLSVSAYPFAGPTVGNKTFVEYAQSAPSAAVKTPYPIAINSTYNSKDVVPHGWNPTMMDEMASIFAVEHLSRHEGDTFLADACSREFSKRIYWIKEPYYHEIELQGQIVCATVDWLKSKAAKAGSDYVRWSSEDVIDGLMPLLEEEWYTKTYGINALIMGQVEKTDGLLQQAYNITGAKTTAELQPYMMYFTSYLLLLGDQHINQYYNIVFDQETNEDFIKAYKKSMNDVKKAAEAEFGISTAVGGTKSVYTARSGMEVLLELFTDVAKFLSYKTVSEPA